MNFSVFFHFDVDCKAVIEYYVKVFKLEMSKDLMTFSQKPENFVSEADKDRIIFTYFPIFGCIIMFSDILSGFHQTKGTNAVLTL
jgi:uncharacterized glyoxalase superfamily protein PhnB